MVLNGVWMVDDISLIATRRSVGLASQGLASRVQFGRLGQRQATNAGVDRREHVVRSPLPGRRLLSPVCKAAPPLGSLLHTLHACCRMTQVRHTRRLGSELHRRSFLIQPVTRKACNISASLMSFELCTCYTPMSSRPIRAPPVTFCPIETPDGLGS